METSGEGAPTRFIKRRKRAKLTDNLKKTCAICGTAAKGLHFGAMACNSCKAFFRRNVQSESYKSFKCSGKKSCPVIKNNRKMCQYCRFQKGISAGMEVKWVMTDEERVVMWKSKLSRQQQHNIGSTSSSLSDHSNLAATTLDNSWGKSFDVLSQTIALLPEVERAIDHLVILQELVFSSNPYAENCHGDTPSALSNLFCSICQKLHSFFLKVDDFHEIPKEDQLRALRSGISMGLYLHGAYNYDLEQREWPDPNIKKALSGPKLSLKTVKILSKYPETYSSLMIFFDDYCSDFKDEAVLAICCIIALFNVQQKNDNDVVEFIQNINNRYVDLLRNYLQHKKGKEEGNKTLSKLLHGLFTVKNITSYHKIIDIKHSFDLERRNREEKVSLVDHMRSFSCIFSKSVTLDIPKYSSALTPEEKTYLKLIRMNQGLTFRKYQILPDPKIDLQFHHPLTNHLLGSDIRTDTLLSFKCQSILHLKLYNQRKRYLTDSCSSCSSFAEGNMLNEDSIELKIKEKDKLKPKEMEKFKTKTQKNSPENSQLNSDATLFESDPIKFSHSITNIAPFASPDKSFALIVQQ